MNWKSTGLKLLWLIILLLFSISLAPLAEYSELLSEKPRLIGWTNEPLLNLPNPIQVHTVPNTQIHPDPPRSSQFPKACIFFSSSTWKIYPEDLLCVSVNQKSMESHQYMEKISEVTETICHTLAKASVTPNCKQQENLMFSLTFTELHHQLVFFVHCEHQP